MLSTDPRRQALIEARADRARPGPCLSCGSVRPLKPGRLGGFHVYCQLCADAEKRTAATLGG